MTRLHILTPGATTSNGRGFVTPLLRFRRALRALGHEVQLFREPSPALFDCDVLGVDSKQHLELWSEGADVVVEAIGDLAQRAPRTWYFDTTDSSGYLAAELLPVVDRYLKAQVLVDRAGYLRPMYGHRPYTDWYHEHEGIVDDQPEWSTPVTEPHLLDRIRVSWNLGTASWSEAALHWARIHRVAPLDAFHRPPRGFADPDRPRPVDVSCRVNLRYGRATVAHQRQRTVELLADHVAVDRLGRHDYFQELRRSKVVVSPFGWGEINLKDYETFLTGAALVKPDVRHLSTWPELFVAGETYAAHRWDLSDLVEVVEGLLEDDERRIAIAAAGQAAYRSAATGAEAATRFAVHLDQLLRERPG
jgi:hypothetical protein